METYRAAEPDQYLTEEPYLYEMLLSIMFSMNIIKFKYTFLYLSKLDSNTTVQDKY